MATVCYSDSLGKVCYDETSKKVCTIITPACVYSETDCEIGALCEDGLTPLYLKLMFANVLCADGCYSCTIPSNRSYDWSGIPDINGEHVLTQVTGEPCHWQLQEAITGTYDAYIGADCVAENFIAGATFACITYDVWFSGGYMTIQVALKEDACDGSATIGMDWAHFYATKAFAELSDCAVVTDLANIYPEEGDTDCEEGFYAFSSGTVSTECTGAP